MNLVESLDAQADRLERNASALDAQEEARRAAYRQAFDACLWKFDVLGIDQPLAGGYFHDLADLIGWACMEGDQAIHRGLMTVFLRCASEGKPDAVAVVDKLRDYFVQQMIENHESSGKAQE